MFSRAALALALLAAFTQTPAERPAVLAHPISLDKAPAAFTRVNRSLREARVLRADFSEEKRIKVLKRPLLSAGNLIFSGELGLYRAVRVPRATELLVTSKFIAQRGADGVVERLELDAQPIAKGFIAAFLLVFSGDDKALATQFDLFFDGTSESWSMGFVPKLEPLSKFIASVVVSGRGEIIETLLVSETSGDTTKTTWSNVVTRRELTADEQERYFAWQE